MRITVQIDDSYAQRIKAIQQRTQLSTTDIIQQAIDLIYKKMELNAKEKNRELPAKLAGIGHGPEDLSINYKKYLDQDWKEKHSIK